MRRCLLVLACAASLVVGVGVDLVQAQQSDHVGITMGFPTSVGVLCPLGAALAIRPELSFSQTSLDTTTLTPSIGGTTSAVSLSTGANHLTAGLSGLVYVRRWDALRAYVTPRFAFARTATTTTATPTFAGTPVSPSSITHEYSVAGSFGAQYSVVRHLGLFGEVGVEYTRSSPALVGTTGHERTIGTISSAGLIFFF
jgi:hypothetical protein